MSSGVLTKSKNKKLNNNNNNNNNDDDDDLLTDPLRGSSPLNYLQIKLSYKT